MYAGSAVCNFSKVKCQAISVVSPMSPIGSGGLFARTFLSASRLRVNRWRNEVERLRNIVLGKLGILVWGIIVGVIVGGTISANIGSIIGGNYGGSVGEVIGATIGATMGAAVVAFIGLFIGAKIEECWKER